MKKSIGIIFFFLLVIVATHGQTVQVCITIDGVAMPVSKTAMLCRQDTAILALTNCAATPEPNVSYRWRNLSVPPNTDSLDNIIMAKDTGRWVGYITNNVTMITYTDTIHLRRPPAINVVSMTPNSGPFCPPDPVNVSLVATGPITTYQWYDKTAGPLVLIPGATNATFTFYDKPKIIMVIAKDTYGCADSLLSGFFSAATAAPANLGPDPAPQCFGTSINVQNMPSALPAYANIQYGYYRLGPLPGPAVYISGNLPGSNNPPGTYNPATVPLPLAGQVKIYFWVKPNFLPCANADTITITVLPLPVVNLGNDTLICYGDDITITPLITGTPPYDLSGPGLGWTSTPAGFTSSANPVTVSPTSSTTYWLRVRDANNCGVGQDDKLVNVNPQININLSNDTTICLLPVGTANLAASVSGGLPSYSYLWTADPTDTVFTNNYDTQITGPASPVTITTYKFVATDANNCKDSSTVTVTPYEPPIATIISPQTINEEVNTTLDASVSGNSGFGFQWYTNLDPSVFSTNSSVFLEYTEPDIDTAGTYYIIRVTNPSNSCANIDSVKIYATSNGTVLYVPNVFSPNAESSMNQRLKIFSSNLNPGDFKFIVYNKWGNLVHETTNYNDMVVEIYSPFDNTINNDSPSKGWDGGSMVEGVYTYVIIGTFRNGKDITESDNYKGTFSLVR